jgi:protein arginine N-methyltransferase 1
VADLHTPYQGLPADLIPLQYHANMLLDEHRMAAFEAAVAHAVLPGTHVLDLGAGTGVLSYFAARRGARVTAVEREPGVLAAARASLHAAALDVTLVHADARDYLPDEPVDVVMCEMLHVGLLRERQIEVLGDFKRRYTARFGGPLPRFLPEATIQAVQPVTQDFSYFGYEVAAPVFQDPFATQSRTVGLAPPHVFQRFFYCDLLPTRCHADLTFTATTSGRLNAVRVLTKNLLAIHLNPPGSVDWTMNHLVVPTDSATPVTAGSQITVRFDYRPGDEIPTLEAGLFVAVMNPPSLI